MFTQCRMFWVRPFHLCHCQARWSPYKYLHSYWSARLCVGTCPRAEHAIMTFSLGVLQSGLVKVIIIFIIIIIYYFKNVLVIYRAYNIYQRTGEDQEILQYFFVWKNMGYLMPAPLGNTILFSLGRKKSLGCCFHHTYPHIFPILPSPLFSCWSFICFPPRPSLT